MLAIQTDFMLVSTRDSDGNHVKSLCEQIGIYLLLRYASFSWYYRSQEELDGLSHWGLVSTYSGAGYVQDLTQNKTESENIISYLFDERWIRRGTRVIFIDFTVYNANINLFCVIR